MNHFGMRISYLHHEYVTICNFPFHNKQSTIATNKQTNKQTKPNLQNTTQYNTTQHKQTNKTSQQKTNKVQMLNVSEALQLSGLETQIHALLERLDGHILANQT